MRYILLSNLFLFSFYMTSYAQIEIDLASLSPGVMHTLPAKTGQNLSIYLKHTLTNPRATYKVTIKKESFVIPKLDLTELMKKLINKESTDSCDTSSLKIQLVSIKSESEIKNLVNQNKNSCETIKTMLEATTRQIVENIDLSQDDVLNVGIQRIIEGDTVNWIIQYEAEKSGRWSVNYGFTFTANLLSPKSTYYAKPDTIAGQYIVKKNNRENKISYVPSVFFTWTPNKKPNKSGLVQSWSGGLGFDLENPVAMTAFTLTYRSNLSFHVGILAMKQAQLRGNFQVGDVVTSSIEPVILHEEVYKPEFFFSLAFRFGKNPFESE